MTDRKMTQKDRAFRIAKNARSVMMGAHIILALGTTVVAWMLIMNFSTLAAFVSPQIHIIIAIAGGLGAYWFLDSKALVWVPEGLNIVLKWFGMKDIGKEVALNQKSPFMRFSDILVVIVAGIILFGSGYMNIVVTPELGSAVAGEVDTAPEQNMLAQNNNVFLAGQGALNGALTEAQKVLTEAQNAKTEAIQAAQNSKGAALARLANSGNDWAKKQIAGAVASATRKADRKINAAQKEVNKAQKAIAAYVTSQGGKVIAGNEKITARISATMADHAQQLGNYTGVMKYIMWSAIALFLICNIMVEIYETETGQSTAPDLSAGQVLGAFGSKLNRGSVAGLARVLGVRDRVEYRMQPGGTIAIATRHQAPAPADAVRRDALGRTLSPEQIREREHWNRDRERQEERRREPAGQNTDRDWESESQKVRKSEQNDTETHRYENKPEQSDGVGVMPSRGDRAEWDNFVKRWRQWCDYYAKSSDPTTKSINRDRILKGIEHIYEQGGIAVWNEETGQRSVKMPLRRAERMETRPLIEYGIDGQETKPGQKAYSGSYDFAIDGDDDNLLFESGRKIEA